MIFAQRTTEKPVLHGNHWLAITGKPLAATAGARIFMQGGNAVDASCAMLAATCTMFDVLSWGGETQALIYNPRTKKVLAINGLGVAPSGGHAQFFKDKGYPYPPAYGPLAAVTPGTPGGLILMLAEFGTLSLKDVLAPAMEMAEGYAIERETAGQHRARQGADQRLALFPEDPAAACGRIPGGPVSGRDFPAAGIAADPEKTGRGRAAGAAERQKPQKGHLAAYDRFYKGDIAAEFVRGCREQGGLISGDDLAKWKPLLEEPVHDHVQRHRRLQALLLGAGAGHAAGVEHAGKPRSEGHGV